MALAPEWSALRAYPVRPDGRVRVRALELHLLSACNLRCAHCCTMTPYEQDLHRVMDPGEVAAELRRATPVLHAEYVKLIGGEPLLHPRLMDCLRAAKEVGGYDQLSVTTNGLLLDEQPDAFWELLDHLTLSLYPGFPRVERFLPELDAKCARFGVELNLKRQPVMERLTEPAPREPEAVRSTFERCWLRHRCNLLWGGRLYLCSRPPHMAGFLHGDDRAFEDDGIDLSPRTGLAGELSAYLERRTPMQTCARCLGGDATAHAFRQLSGGEVRLRVLP